MYYQCGMVELKRKKRLVSIIKRAFLTLAAGLIKLPKKRWFLPLALSIIVGIAFFFRFQLSQNSGVWQDETTVYSLASYFPVKDLLVLNHWDKAHPPLLYIFFRVILVLHNLQPIPIQTIRIVFVVFSSLAVIPLFLISRKWLKNDYSALFVVLWYALSSFHVRSGYSARPYSILQFFLPIAFFAFDLEKFKSKKAFFLWNVLFVFLFYWDYASLWFFLCFFAYKLIAGHKKLFQTIVTQIKMFWPFFLGVMIWIPIFVKSYVKAVDLENYLKPKIFVDLYDMAFFNFQEINIFERVEPVNWGFMLTIVLFIFAYQHRQNLKKALLLTIFFVVPPFLAFVYGFLHSPILTQRNHIFSALSLLILLGFATKPKPYGMIFGAIISFVFLVALITHTVPLQFRETEVAISPEVLEQIKAQQTVTVTTMERGDTELHHALLYALLQNGLRPTTGFLYNFENQGKIIGTMVFNLDDEVDISVQKIDYLLITPGKADMLLADEQATLKRCNVSPALFSLSELSKSYELVSCRSIDN